MRLYQLEMEPSSETFPPRPRIVKLTSDAKEFWIAWHDAHCREFNNSTFPQDLKWFYAKLKGYCARFALILGVSSNPGTQVIDLESMEGACALTEYFKAQAGTILPWFKQYKSSP